MRSAKKETAMEKKIKSPYHGHDLMTRSELYKSDKRLLREAGRLKGKIQTKLRKLSTELEAVQHMRLDHLELRSKVINRSLRSLEKEIRIEVRRQEQKLREEVSFEKYLAGRVRRHLESQSKKAK